MLDFESVFLDTVSSKLQNNNVYTIAKRNVEGQDMLYQSLKLTNGIWILAELRIQPGNPNYTVRPFSEWVRWVQGGGVRALSFFLSIQERPGRGASDARYPKQAVSKEVPSCLLRRPSVCSVCPIQQARCLATRVSQTPPGMYRVAHRTWQLHQYWLILNLAYLCMWYCNKLLRGLFP